MLFDKGISTIFISSLINFQIPGLGLIFSGKNTLLGVWIMVASVFFGLVATYPNSSNLDVFLSYLGLDLLLLISNIYILVDAIKEV